ncbi:MAG: MarR family transcriptional regulator [Defluviitaleaceae bacterium]|nr:MarR family transcriptional regulator [Defluviitaleaceae bacterium]
MQDARARFKELWHRIDTLFNAYAKKQGINFTALLILELLTEAAHDSAAPPYTQKALCEKLVLPKQLVNALINTFREQGYVELREARDRRNKEIRLTISGQAYAKSIIEPLDAADEQAWQTFNDNELAIFAAALEKYERTMMALLG